MSDTEPTRCAMCGAIIVPAGEAWDHVGEPKPRHPAIPVGEWPRGKYRHIEIPPDLTDAGAMLATVLARLQRLEAERERLRAALDAYPDSDLASLALTLRTRNEGLEARAARDRALVEAALAYQHANDTLSDDWRVHHRALLAAARAWREEAPDAPR